MNFELGNADFPIFSKDIVTCDSLDTKLGSIVVISIYYFYSITISLFPFSIGAVDVICMDFFQNWIFIPPLQPTTSTQTKPNTDSRPEINSKLVEIRCALIPIKNGAGWIKNRAFHYLFFYRVPLISSFICITVS